VKEKSLKRLRGKLARKRKETEREREGEGG